MQAAQDNVHCAEGACEQYSVIMSLWKTASGDSQAIPGSCSDLGLTKYVEIQTLAKASTGFSDEILIVAGYSRLSWHPFRIWAPTHLCGQFQRCSAPLASQRLYHWSPPASKGVNTTSKGHQSTTYSTGIVMGVRTLIHWSILKLPYW